jgi:hypothetical protein
MARKPWEQLSPQYRSRLLRRGISQQQHESGVPLHVARGHISVADESRQRLIRQFLRTYARDGEAPRLWAEPWVTIDADEIRQWFAQMSTADIRNYIQSRRQAERLYIQGHTDRATGVFARSGGSGQPEWMWFYHGLFS